MCLICAVTEGQSSKLFLFPPNFHAGWSMNVLLTEKDLLSSSGPCRSLRVCTHICVK